MTSAPTPARGIYNILEGVSGMFTGWTFNVGGVVDSPDRQISLIDTGGFAPEVAVAIDYPSVQVFGIAESTAGGYEALYQKMVAVRNALLGIPSRPALWTELDSVVGLGHILPLGRDERDRPQMSCNFRLIVSYSTSGYRD